MAGKVEKTGKGNWGSPGGNNSMHKFAPTGTQTPGQSSQEGHSGSRRGITAAGGTKDALQGPGQKNKDYAGTQEPGQSASCKAGPNNKFAEGGKTHMWGNRGSRPVVPGQSGPN